MKKIAVLLLTFFIFSVIAPVTSAMTEEKIFATINGEKISVSKVREMEKYIKTQMNKLGVKNFSKYRKNYDLNSDKGKVIYINLLRQRIDEIEKLKVKKSSSNFKILKLKNEERLLTNQSDSHLLNNNAKIEYSIPAYGKEIKTKYINGVLNATNAITP